MLDVYSPGGMLHENAHATYLQLIGKAQLQVLSLKGNSNNLLLRSDLGLLNEYAMKRKPLIIYYK